MNRNTFGFTLIEMTMVLWIVGLLFYGSFEVSKFFMNQNNIRATIAKMNTIQAALDIYLLQNGRLPCPAGLKLSDGAALATCNASNTTAGLLASTTVARGGVPYAELGLSPDISHDAWRSKILYTVAVAATNDFKKMDPINYSGMTIYDYITGYNLISSKGVYSLISQGKNKFGSFGYDSNSQLSTSGIPAAENYNTGSYSTSNLTMYFPSSNKVNDDIVVYKTRIQMIYDLNYDDIGCYANTTTIGAVITLANITTGTPTFDAPSDSFLGYNEELSSTNSYKYKLKCFKYGRLGVYSYE